MEYVKFCKLYLRAEFVFPLLFFFMLTALYGCGVTPGVTGAAGTAGSDGQSGQNGLQGPVGPTGAIGPTGPSALGNGCDILNMQLISMKPNQATVTVWVQDLTTGRTSLDKDLKTMYGSGGIWFLNGLNTSSSNTALGFTPLTVVASNFTTDNTAVALTITGLPTRSANCAVAVAGNTNFSPEGVIYISSQQLSTQQYFAVDVNGIPTGVCYNYAAISVPYLCTGSN